MTSPLSSMMVDLSLTYKRPSAYSVKRKPAPTLSLEERYPPPDLTDPFASLSHLREQHLPPHYKTRSMSTSESGRPPLVALPAFQLAADMPSPIGRQLPVSYLSEGEAGPSRPPRSPFRRGPKSLSSSNLLPLLSSSAPVEHHASQGGVQFTAPKWTEDRASPTPSLIADGPSDSSEGDAELPSPRSDTGYGLSGKGTPSKKMFRRLIGKKPSPNALPPLFVVGEKSPGLRRHSTTATLVSSNTSSPVQKIFPTRPLELPINSAVFQETLAKLNGVEADFGVPKPVPPLDSVSARGAPLRDRPRLQQLSETDPLINHSSPSHTDDTLLPQTNASNPEGSVEYNHPLTLMQFTLAACIPVVDALGARVPFAELINVSSASVLFVRHWNCLSSQTYVRDIVPQVPPGQKLIIVGNGSHTFIPKYRKACDIPEFVEVYAEPSLRIHRALGMGATSEKEMDKSETKKNSSLAKAVVRALKSNAHYGPATQLGGEFHFKSEGDSLICTYAHRMENTKDHGPVKGFIPSLAFPSAFRDRTSNASESDSEASSSGTSEIEEHSALLRTVNTRQ